MPSIGMQAAWQVADALAQDRIKKEEEAYSKANKGKSLGNTRFGKTPGQVAPEMSSPGFQEQRAGERMDYTTPMPEQLGGPTEEPGMGWQMDPTMGMSLFGSGQFTAKELRKGYRKLKG